MGGETLTPRLFSLHFMQQFPQTHVSSVQLRLRNALRVPQHLCNLVVFVPLDVMQDKYGTIAQLQLRAAAPEIHSTNRSLRKQVGGRKVNLQRSRPMAW